jgi:uncharacterized protein YutE (UPF0331/DUF86 family)
MDRRVIEQKLEVLRSVVVRISDKCPADAEILARDFDAQDIVSLNFTRAVQLCVDIAVQLIASREIPAPDTMGQAFDLLADAGFIDPELASHLKKTVGFRNLVTHDYSAIDWRIVHSICRSHLDDFRDFAAVILNLEKP